MIFPAQVVHRPPILMFDVVSGKGLTLQSRGIPLIEGSLIQFYKPGWSKGYYSSNWNSQKIDRVDRNTVNVTCASDDGVAQAKVVYTLKQDHLQIHFDLVWNGDEPANAEVAPGLLWAPAFRQGSLTADGKPTRDLSQTDYKSDAASERRFSPDAKSYTFATSLGAISEVSSIPLTLSDGRGSKEEWAIHHDFLWLGATDLALQKGKHLEFDVDFQVDLTRLDEARSFSFNPTAHVAPAAFLPDTARPPLIPKPITARLDWAHPVRYENAFTFPAGIFDHLDQFQAAMKRRFEIGSITPGAKIAFDGGVAKLGLVPGGYKITITPNSISVIGEEDEGLRNGLERLAALAFIHDGKLYFPTGFLRDQPQTKFRGVHLFVGKQSLAFHEKLWTRVLRPLGMNHVVLQCERTHWDCQPGIDTAMTMPKSGLVELFKMYRDLGIDPIPLIESFGHMQWFFANGKNGDLALDPAHPYAVDPANPKTAIALRTLWDEAITALKPDVVHYGLDEVDLVGKKLSPTEKTNLWATQLGTLEQITRSHRLQMMLWGDQALAPSEAPDAGLAESVKDAADRRAAIPKGSLIGDWHYLENGDPKVYLKTLQTWKDAGTNPIATAWYKPENIAGFFTEAARLGCGSLETTWCGYESSEANLHEAFEQFSAMILGADYAWSARPEIPEKLDYDPATVFRKMYFGVPSPLKPKSGLDFELPNPLANPMVIGQVRYGSPGRLTIPSMLLPSGDGIAGAKISLASAASDLYFAVNTLNQAPEDGVAVAEIAVSFEDGHELVKQLTYGDNVRAVDDRAATPFADRSPEGICSVSFNLGGEKSKIRQITIRQANHFSGLVIRGIEAVG